jgi:hypothetical protein
MLNRGMVDGKGELKGLDEKPSKQELGLSRKF